MKAVLILVVVAGLSGYAFFLGVGALSVPPPAALNETARTIVGGLGAFGMVACAIIALAALSVRKPPAQTHERSRPF